MGGEEVMGGRGGEGGGEGVRRAAENVFPHLVAVGRRVVASSSKSRSEEILDSGCWLMSRSTNE